MLDLFALWVGRLTLAAWAVFLVLVLWRVLACRLGRHALVEVFDWEDDRPTWIRLACAYCDHEEPGRKPYEVGR